MPRGKPGASLLERPSTSTPSTGLGLGAIPTMTPDHQVLNYDAMLAEAGVFRQGGGLYRWAPVVTIAQDGRTRRREKRFPVALDGEQARALTKATGERHDWYDPGTQCPKCQHMLSGWVLGGRKRSDEHDHVTDFEPGLYREVDAEDETADDLVAVEA